MFHIKVHVEVFFYYFVQIIGWFKVYLIDICVKEPHHVRGSKLGTNTKIKTTNITPEMIPVCWKIRVSKSKMVKYVGGVSVV